MEKIKILKSKVTGFRKENKLKVISEMKTKLEGTQEKMTMDNIFRQKKLNGGLFKEIVERDKKRIWEKLIVKKIDKEDLTYAWYDLPKRKTKATEKNIY